MSASRLSAEILPVCSHSVCVHNVHLSVLLWLNAVSLASAIPSGVLESFLPPLLQGSSLSEGRDLMEASLSEPSVPRSLTLCTLPSYGSLYLFSLLQEDASLMMAEQGTALGVCQNADRSPSVATLL